MILAFAMKRKTVLCVTDSSCAFLLMLFSFGLSEVTFLVVCQAALLRERSAAVALEGFLTSVCHHVPRELQNAHVRVGQHVLW